MGQRIDFYIKKPGNGRASFAIIRRAEKTETLKLPLLDDINARYHTGKETLESALLLIKDLIVGLKKQAGLIKLPIYRNGANLKRLDEVWSERFEHRQYANTGSKLAVYSDFRRAVEAIGKLDIFTAEDIEIEREVAKQFSGTKRQRVLEDIACLCKHLGRAERKFTKWRKPKQKPKHLSKIELYKVLTYLKQEKVDEDVLLFYEAAFYCGGRKGEMAALTEEKFFDKSIFIDEQRTRTGDLAEPKWGSSGYAFIPPEGRDVVKRWCQVAIDKKLKIRNMTHSKVLTKACQALWPLDKVKHCTPHDIRHSYAIFCLGRGLTLDIVSKSLREEYRTCEEYYQGFILQDTMIAAAEEMFKK